MTDISKQGQHSTERLRVALPAGLVLLALLYLLSRENFLLFYALAGSLVHNAISATCFRRHWCRRGGDGLAYLGLHGAISQAFVEGEGLTTFKVWSEYAVVGVLLLTVGAEISFTFYVSVYGFSNFVGHIFKLG